ncbi:MAG: sigma-70 family RNA polymerase sigma factor [Verrucomicrobiota bacterium]|jgi:RNA polymerase sigma factor (sigma-70 family)
MTDDQELLGDYRIRRSETAFAELVRRYVDLVYSTALRAAGDSETAKDVSQAVFIEFARKADSIRAGAALPGWLYRVACCQAKNAIRTEHRRRRREEEALNMADLNESDSGSWEQIAPLLDEAMQELDKTDQDAVIWRFFQDRSFRQIGLALAVSDDAAQKRVSRALDRLRELLAKRGVSVGAGGLAVVISANATHAAPAGLAGSISTAALAATTTGTGVTVSLLKLMTMTKLQTALIGAIAVATLVVTPLVMQHEADLRGQNQRLRQQLAQINIANQALSNRLASALRSRAPRAAAASATNLTAAGPPYQQVLEFIGSHNRQLSREQIETYLRQNHRDVESLLAAFQVSLDASYLREAATNSPNNPAVQFAVIANNVFPDQQRKWIDAFKVSSPENALAWYYSALDYFHSNQPGPAIQELTQATRRQLYTDYATQTGEAVEEMYDSAGWPALAAKAIAPGTTTSSVSYLNVLKDLGNQTVQTQQQYVSQGDTASATSMASMGITLGNQLRQASGPIDELVGIAIEKKILAQLDPAQTYDFLDGPLSQVEGELDQQKQAIRQALETRDEVRPTLNESDLNDYWEREKMYGEMYALQWLQSKYPLAATNQ